MTLIALINPNTDPTVTSRMLAAARRAAPPAICIRGMTVQHGVSLITTEAELAQAADAVEALLPRLSGMNGAIVSAFGDPGLDRLRHRFAWPVVGIGECALREAARDGRRFAVVTTTPALVGSIEQAVERLGLGHAFAGIALTRSDPRTLTGDADRLAAELGSVVDRLTTEESVGAIVVGGGPLVDAALKLTMPRHIAIVEPVAAAIRFLAPLLAPSLTRIAQPT